MKKISLTFQSFIIFFFITSAYSAQTTKKLTTQLKSDFSTYLFYYLIIPTIILVIIGHLLVRNKKCIIFYGRKDQMNSFFTFTLPIVFYIILHIFLSLFTIHELIKKWVPLSIAIIIFLYGFFHLIRNAIIFNKESKAFIPFVIFMKIYIGLWVGIAFVFSIWSWGTNLRYANKNTRSWIWLIRLLSYIVGFIFIFIAKLLTYYPENEEEESKLKGYDGPIPIGKKPFRL